MKFSTIKKWNNTDETAGLLFFAQRAEELLFDYSLDSFKPPALNAAYLAREATNLISDINRGLIDKRNLEHVLEELIWSVENDPIAKSLIDLPLADYIPNSKVEDIEKLRINLEVLGKTLDPYRYLDHCIEKLKKAITNHKKIAIDQITTRLFSVLVNFGLHKSYLYEKTQQYFFHSSEPKEINSSSDVNGYFDQIYPRAHEYEVYFLVSHLIEKLEDSTESFGIEVIDEFSQEFQDACDSLGFKPEEDEVIAKIEDFHALDCCSAREIAETRLGRLRDVFTLFHHKECICWKSKALVKQCCVEGFRLVQLPGNAIENVYDRRPESAAIQLRRMLEGFGLSNKDWVKFTRSVDFHGLCVNNADPENQLLNLWIALETITPTHTGKAKIKQIIDGLLPFLAINYVWRIIQTLTRDLTRWNSEQLKKVLRSDPLLQNGRLSRKVFLLLTHPDCEGSRDDLYRRLLDFHLLRYRFWKLSKSLSTPEKLLQYLKNHETKVKWQIRRIYRTRNLIVHSGRTPPYLQTLIENGHDYLDQVLISIIRMSTSPYRIRSIEQAFELAKVARRKFNRTLKDSDSFTDDAISLLLNDQDFTRISRD